MTNITKNMKYADILSILHGENPAYGCSLETLTAFIEHEMELTAKKNAAPKKPSKAQVEKQEENKVLAQTLFEVLAAHGKDVSVAEIKKLDDRFVDLSSPKITALLKILMDENRMVKDDSGRVARYQVLA